MWKTPPRCVLVLKKLDATLDFQLDQVAAFLGLEEGLTVVVEAHDYRRMRAAYGWTFLESFDDDEKPQLHQVPYKHLIYQNPICYTQLVHYDTLNRSSILS